MSGYNGFLEYSDTSDDHAAMTFLVQMMLNKIATNTLVQVTAVTNAGALAPVGLLHARPMIHQVDGAGNPVPHDVVHNIPYFRLQGGQDAVIIDPKVGDIGLAAFCSRDLTNVKRTRTSGTPGSWRMFDWADALYIGGILNGVPNQYIRFSSSGVEITSPTAITLNAQTVTINANVSTVGTLTNNSHDVGSTHRHTASGGTGVGGPPQ